MVNARLMGVLRQMRKALGVDARVTILEDMLLAASTQLSSADLEMTIEAGRTSYARSRKFMMGAFEYGGREGPGTGGVVSGDAEG